MVLVLVSNKGDVMPTHFFTKGIKISTYQYLKVLDEALDRQSCRWTPIQLSTGQ
jgi:hypothetical protein